MADKSINLQVALSASSAIPLPVGSLINHHPIACVGTLYYHEDGSFACEHGSVPPGDLRTGYCVDHSLALLVIELARDL